MNLILSFLMVFLLPAALIAQDFIDVDGGGMTYTMVSEEESETFRIRVKDFRMAETEVTVAQWRAFTEDTGFDFCWVDHYCGDIATLSPGKECPIQLVRIEEAVQFCNWLSDRDGYERVYFQDGDRIHRNRRADGYRLPTSEEWDYAARGGRDSRGYVFAGSDNAAEVAWYGYEFEDGTRPVATKKPNELGIYDMSGNVREWTWPESGIPFPASGIEETIWVRGGSWLSDETGVRLDFVRYVHPYTWNVIGFRLARNAE